MSAIAVLRHSQWHLHQAEKCAKSGLDPDTFSMIAEDFDSLIRQIDALAQVEHLLHHTDPGDHNVSQRGL